MIDDRPLLCAFVKVRNEIVREGNIYRLLDNLDRYVDAAVILDDGSTDGTAEAITKWISGKPDGAFTSTSGVAKTEGQVLEGRRWVGMLVDADHPEREFGKEILWKSRMLDVVHRIRPHFVLWMDGDEVFDAVGTAKIRTFCQDRLVRDPARDGEGGILLPPLERDVAAWAFHYTQLWRTSTWARTDEGFDDGWFIKLWRYTPDLAYDLPSGPEAWGGLHHAQFPRQIGEAFNAGQTRRVDGIEQIHYGNFGSNLRWKCIQYWGGLGGVDRHLLFDRAQYRPVDPCTLPEGAESWPVLGDDHHALQGTNQVHKITAKTIVNPPGIPPVHLPTFLSSRPLPFTAIEVERIRELRNLRGLERTFTVVIPTYNRGYALDRTLQSLLDQTYPHWVALVIDDGSTDDTRALLRSWQERDPRIFYARYPTNRGGVAANEVGMRLACEWTEWWARLGSDDYFGKRKLEHDAATLVDHDACFGAYFARRGDTLAEVCNAPQTAATVASALRSQVFMASWANCAVRTSVLRKLVERWGHFCDPRIRNMEDFLVNTRIARVSRGWVWRGLIEGELVVNPPLDRIKALQDRFLVDRHADEVEAVWTDATGTTAAASGNMLQTAKDDNLTRALITEDNIADARAAGGA